MFDDLGMEPYRGPGGIASSPARTLRPCRSPPPNTNNRFEESATKPLLLILGTLSFVVSHLLSLSTLLHFPFPSLSPLSLVLHSIGPLFSFPPRSINSFSLFPLYSHF
jgi:hypothetical protein